MGSHRARAPCNALTILYGRAMRSLPRVALIAALVLCAPQLALAQAHQAETELALLQKDRMIADVWRAVAERQQADFSRR